MSSRFAKALCLLLTLIIVFSATGCTKTEEQQDNSQLTMSVSLGNTTGPYYDYLHDAILKDTGVDVKLVYNHLLDNSSALKLSLANDDVQTDIVISANHIPVELQKKSFLELGAISEIPSSFSTDTLENVSIDGEIYQLPFGSRLMGIGYNKTLMKEMGWELPNTFEDMVNLKKECEAKGITFSLTADTMSGHGFNYLFSVCGTDYISSPDGSQWLTGFLSGNEGTEKFEEPSTYFQKWVSEGLFGEIVTDNWSWANTYRQKRALFLIELTSSLSENYSGIHYDNEGKIVGASYDNNGELVTEIKEDGGFVSVNGVILKYNDSDESMKGLDRFDIPGAEIVNDEYGIMPWISEDGSSNCYVTYDVMNISLSKKLGESNQKDRLEKALKVLAYMTTNECISLQSDIFRDGYVATKDFIIDESRMYYEFSDKIKSGYIMPWYYNSFDDDSIVNIGYTVNDIMAGIKKNDNRTILDVMLEYRDKFLNKEETVYGTVTDNFTFKQTSEVVAVGEGISLQEKLDEAGIDETVSIALIPYIESYDSIPRNIILGAVQSKLYKGNFNDITGKTIVVNTGYQPVGIYMTGQEIKEIVDNGYDKAKVDFGKDGYGKLNYTCLVKGNMEIQDEETYLVAVDPGSLLNSQYELFKTSQKVIMSEDGATPITGNAIEGMISYLEKNKTFTPEQIVW